MAYTLTNPPSEKCELTPKNRVWDFFENSNRTRPANRRKPSELRRKNCPTTTKTASGIPYWPSRDPIEERGGVNLYGFVVNNGVNKWDYLGLDTYVLIYDTTDQIFDEWSDNVEDTIKDATRVTMYGNAFTDYDCSKDEIVRIDGSKSDGWDKIKKLKNVAYIGSFGHGNGIFMWYNKTSERVSSVAIGKVDTREDYKSNPKSTYKLTSDLKGIDFTTNAFVELYHCFTATGENKGKPSIRSELQDTFGVDVYGSYVGLSNNHFGYYVTLGGWLGELAPEEEPPTPANPLKRPPSLPPSRPKVAP